VKTVSVEFAQELIDFAPTAQSRTMGFGESQLQGAVAAYNMLARNGVAYLADEVGMGKTYVALGVVGILRHLKPDARVMVIAPRENIQRKWIKELGNFVRVNWRVEDNRFKGLDDRPVYGTVACDSLE
jgi:superfamily II DNA or RNA helicase